MKVVNNMYTYINTEEGTISYTLLSYCSIEFLWPSKRLNEDESERSILPRISSEYNIEFLQEMRKANKLWKKLEFV